MSEKVFGVYIRVSTNKEGDSVEMQKNLADKFIKEQGGILYKYYVEDGVSATKTKLKDRTKLLECLDDAKKGLINNVIAYKRDRIARKTEDSLAIRSALEKSDCKIHFTATGEQQMMLNDPYGKLMENVYSSLAEIESAQTAVRVSDTMFDKAQRGEITGGNVTYGYENVNGRLEPIESQIPIIEEVVDMYMEGFGVHSIVRWLEGKTVRNKGTRHTRAKKLKQLKSSSSNWTRENVISMLFNPTHSGYMRYTKRYNNENKEIMIESPYITPIRTKEEQDKIDRERERRRKSIRPARTYTTSFLLTGILYCSECGREYGTRTSTRSNGDRYSYYICKGRQRNDAFLCKSRSYRKEILEEFILLKAKEHVKNFVNSNLHAKFKKEIQKKDESLSKKLTEVKRDLGQREKDLKSMSRLLLDLDPDDETYEMMRDMYQEQQREILVKINDLKKTKDKIEKELEIQSDEEIDINQVIEHFKDFQDTIEHSPVHLQKRLLESLFSKIEISKVGEVTYQLTYEVDKIESTVETVTISDIKVNDKNEFMLFGGVGDPTSPKNITFTLNEKDYSINYFDWLESLVNFICNEVKDIIINRNKKLKNQTYFSKTTKINLATIREYVYYGGIPNYNNFKKMLSVAKISVEELVTIIKNNSILCNVKILEYVLSNNIAIGIQLGRQRNANRGEKA